MTCKEWWRVFLQIFLHFEEYSLLLQGFYVFGVGPGSLQEPLKNISLLTLSLADPHPLQQWDKKLVLALVLNNHNFKRRNFVMTILESWGKWYHGKEVISKHCEMQFKQVLQVWCLHSLMFSPWSASYTLSSHLQNLNTVDFSPSETSAFCAVENLILCPYHILLVCPFSKHQRAH